MRGKGRGGGEQGGGGGRKVDTDALAYVRAQHLCICISKSYALERLHM